MKQPRLSFFRLKAPPRQGVSYSPLCALRKHIVWAHRERELRKFLLEIKFSFHPMTSDIAFPNDLTAALGAGEIIVSIFRGSGRGCQHSSFPEQEARAQTQVSIQGTSLFSPFSAHGHINLLTYSSLPMGPAYNSEEMIRQFLEVQ